MRCREDFVLSHFVFGILPEHGFTLQRRGPRGQCEFLLTVIMLLKDHLDLLARPQHFRCSLIVEPPLVAHDRCPDLEVRLVIKVLFVECHTLIHVLLTVGDLDDSLRSIERSNWSPFGPSP